MHILNSDLSFRGYSEFQTQTKLDITLFHFFFLRDIHACIHNKELFSFLGAGDWASLKSKHACIYFYVCDLSLGTLRKS